MQRPTVMALLTCNTAACLNALALMGADPLHVAGPRTAHASTSMRAGQLSRPQNASGGRRVQLWSWEVAVLRLGDARFCAWPARLTRGRGHESGRLHQRLLAGSSPSHGGSSPAAAQP
jgi:hypothetical protein